ncbi:MAG: amino acid permease [Alphaproteobacteria bacterium]|nr:amino acid permease [Alphaproteobacteria bacterium]
MTDHKSSIHYQKVDNDYFNKRELRRHARVWSLWALGVGAVISGHFSGWNLGLAAGGFGGFFIAAIIIAIMYLGLSYSLAEMSPALPHTGGAYSFARASMGPWGGFITGLAENIEYVLTPAVIVFFIGSYLGTIFGTDPSFQPLWWLAGYIVFVTLNVIGVELSFRISVIVTLLALTVLAVFWISAIPHFDFTKWALNIGVNPEGQAIQLAEGGGSFLPFGVKGIFASLPLAVWLFLAIEQLPLAAEESHDPQKDMPKGLLLGIATLIFSAFMTLFLNSSIGVTSADGQSSGAFYLGTSGEPLLDGFRAIYGTQTSAASILALCAVIGLIASFHTIIFAFGRQIYSLSRAGYFPRSLSITHGKRKTPHLALITGAAVGFLVMIVIWLTVGEEHRNTFIGGILLNMAVFGAMISYIMQGVSFILLRKKMPHIKRPYVSPFGVTGAVLTIIIAAVTIFFQFQDPLYRDGVIGVLIWYIAGILYFAAVGRKHLVKSPEEEFALEQQAKVLVNP